MGALLRKIEAHVGPEASGMGQAHAASLRADMWEAPPVPVVCVIGAGVQTHVSFGYCEGWPRSMREESHACSVRKARPVHSSQSCSREQEPCVLRFEDGDTTVPVRSAQSVCDHWQRQKRCLSPLSTVHPQRYRAEPFRSECVEVVHLHCKGHTMEAEAAHRQAEAAREWSGEAGCGASRRRGSPAAETTALSTTSGSCTSGRPSTSCRASPSTSTR